jgi:hypothetical protein
MATFLLLLFPTGHLPSRRWRPVAWAAGATITGMTLVAAVAPVPPGDGLPTNPLGIQQLARAWELTLSIGALLFGALAVASAASLVVRFRHARGEERQQLKWFTYGAGGLVVLVAVPATVPTLGDWVPNLVSRPPSERSRWPSASPSCATASTTSTGSSTAPWSMACSPPSLGWGMRPGRASRAGWSRL